MKRFGYAVLGLGCLVWALAAGAREPVNEYQLGWDARQAGDEVAAHRWWQIAARQDNAWAHYALGYSYQYGVGVKANMLTALMHYEAAAAQDLPQANYALGNVYYHGQLVKQDYAKARAYYEQAAAHSMALAFHALGLLYQYGHGVAVDLERARLYYEQAAAQGDERSEQILQTWD